LEKKRKKSKRKREREMPSRTAEEKKSGSHHREHCSTGVVAYQKEQGSRLAWSSRFPRPIFSKSGFEKTLKYLHFLQCPHLQQHDMESLRCAEAKKTEACVDKTMARRGPEWHSSIQRGEVAYNGAKREKIDPWFP
jgi:hypothetical protein